MNICVQCKKPCVLIRVKSPEDGKDYLVNELCQDCIFQIGDSLEAANDPRYECRRCKTKVFVLRNKECRECWELGKTTISILPDYVEPLDPPLGWTLIGCTPEETEREANYAYSLTPRWYELHN